jgi:KDO2-lipid IV(A) lauroyltransferase
MILATAHTGGWQVAGLAVERLLGCEMLVVMRRERDPRAQALQDDARERAGVRFAYVGDDPLASLGLLGHLRRGGVVAMQIDRLPPRMRGRTGRLFGVPFSIPEGPLRLAAVSGAPIVPVFTRRLGYMDYDVLVADAIRLPRRPADADLDDAAAAVLRATEAFVRANPTQWFHFE